MSDHLCKNCETPHNTTEEADECCACARCAELELAHDKAITNGIEIVKGRDARIKELEAQLDAYRKGHGHYELLALSIDIQKKQATRIEELEVELKTARATVGRVKPLVERWQDANKEQETDACYALAQCTEELETALQEPNHD